MGDAAVETMIAQSHVVAREQARLLELVLQVVETAPEARFGVDEVAFALTLTHAAASAQENLARQLIDGLRSVFTALRAGEIDLPKARVFADVLATLDPKVAEAVAAAVLPIAAKKTTAQLRPILHRRALAADPQHARKQRARGIRERRVIVEQALDGNARLTALGLQPHRAQAAYERVTAIAKARKLSGATGNIDQLRADALLDLLDGTHIDATPGPRRGVVELIVGLTTLAGLDENAGTLHGFGPVAADIARQCAAADLSAQWRFSVVDPESGDLLFHGITPARPTQPTQTQPAQAQRAHAQPAQTQRARTQPKPTQPGQARRTPAQPAQTQPTQAQPAQTQPTQAQPAQAQRTPTQPAQTQPTQAQPTQARRTPTQPGQARRTPAQPAQTQRTPACPARPQSAQAPHPQAQPGQAQPGQAQSGHSWPEQAWRIKARPRPCPPRQDPDARFPNTAMAAWIRARDRTCRAPGCRIPARACHLDHTIDYARGGRTTHDDLEPLCGRHHVMKHKGGWRLYQIQPGHFIWISPTNRIYYVGPEPP